MKQFMIYNTGKTYQYLRELDCKNKTINLKGSQRRKNDTYDKYTSILAQMYAGPEGMFECEEKVYVGRIFKLVIDGEKFTTAAVCDNDGNEDIVLSFDNVENSRNILVDYNTTY